MKTVFLFKKEPKDNAPFSHPAKTRAVQEVIIIVNIEVREEDDEIERWRERGGEGEGEGRRSDRGRLKVPLEGTGLHMHIPSPQIQTNPRHNTRCPGTANRQAKRAKETGWLSKHSRRFQICQTKCASSTNFLPIRFLL